MSDANDDIRFTAPLAPAGRWNRLTRNEQAWTTFIRIISGGRDPKITPERVRALREVLDAGRGVGQGLLPVPQLQDRGRSGLRFIVGKGVEQERRVEHAADLDLTFVSFDVAQPSTGAARPHPHGSGKSTGALPAPDTVGRAPVAPGDLFDGQAGGRYLGLFGHLVPWSALGTRAIPAP